MTPHDELYSLIAALSAVDSVSAREDSLRELLANELRGHVDSVRTDAMGNLIASRPGRSESQSGRAESGAVAGSGPTVRAGGPTLLFASMDEPGLVVTHIAEDGLLHVAPVGEVSAQEALGAFVRLLKGAGGVVVSGQAKDERAPEFGDLRIDVGAVSKEEAGRVASVGDRVAYVFPLERRGDVVMGKALESRVACAVLVQALKRSTAGNLQVVFAAQEQLGGRGLLAFSSAGSEGAAGGNGRGYGRAIGVGLVEAKSKATSSAPARLGAGPALVVQDGAYVADAGSIRLLEAAAGKAGVSLQRFVSQDVAKGAGYVQRSPGGVPTVRIGIPARNASGLCQIVNLADAVAAVELLVQSLEMGRLPG